MPVVCIAFSEMQVTFHHGRQGSSESGSCEIRQLENAASANDASSCPLVVPRKKGAKPNRVSIQQDAVGTDAHSGRQLGGAKLVQIDGQFPRETVDHLASHLGLGSSLGNIAAVLSEQFNQEGLLDCF